MPIKHTKNADGKGWLIVKYSSDSSTYPPLPQFTRVDFINTAGGRDIFKILEGRSKDREASVVTGNLNNGDPQQSAGTIRFDRRAKKLWFGGTGSINAITDPTNPVPLGTFSLEIPDEPHPLGAQYENRTIYAKSWFRIGDSGDRYLHPGGISAGCITVIDIEKWTDIYNYLIQRRKDAKSVGTVEIFESSVLKIGTDVLQIAIPPELKIDKSLLKTLRELNPEIDIKYSAGEANLTIKEISEEQLLRRRKSNKKK